MILLFSSILFGDALGMSLMMFRGRMRTIAADKKDVVLIRMELTMRK